MDNIESKFEQIGNREVPSGLHAKVMRNLFFLKFRIPLLTAIFLSSLNLLVTARHLWLKIGEMETISLLKTVFNGFDFTFDYLSDFFQTIIENSPINLLFIFILNSLLVAYLIYLFYSFKRSKQFSIY